MSLQPLLSASPAIKIHAFVAMAAFVIGVVQLVRAKGDGAHRVLGYAWVAMMIVIAASSFAINGINQWRGFSAIHLISIFVLINVPLAIVHVRRGKVGAHRNAMIGTFIGGLVVAGLFTFVPGRIMHAVVFGP